MSNGNKYLLSALFVMTALLAIAYNSRETAPEVLPPAVHNHQHPDTDIGFDFHSLLADADVKASDDAAILSVMAMTPEACTPCLNNVADLRDAIDADDAIQSLVLLFSNEPEWRVAHFVHTSGLDIPYILKHEEEELRATEALQHILFVDAETKELFYSEPVPNTTTPFEAKEELLARVKHVWAVGYKPADEPSTKNRTVVPTKTTNKKGE
ncbi:MAG: hypothetical protein EA391_13790 [Balneolaceae bacterium]|nr:MAG: hypothetical protein EA391_13790 [Balneolaceae bacterium]